MTLRKFSALYKEIVLNLYVNFRRIDMLTCEIFITNKDVFFVKSCFIFLVFFSLNVLYMLNFHFFKDLISHHLMGLKLLIYISFWEVSSY